MTAVVYRFRAELRRRWRAWGVVGLGVGLAGGLVVALVAGARRTDSAYDRFLVEHDSSDLLLISGVPDLFEFAPLDLDAVAQMPEVADSTPLRVIPVAGRTPDGRFVAADEFNFAG